MANPFGGFVHTSPLSSLPHSPPLTLASNCIRDHFGPTVQTVADCLLSRGDSTLAQIISKVRVQCRRVLNEERERLVDTLPAKSGARKAKINKARGPEQSGFVVDAAPIRAALIVLVQHSIVTALPPKEGKESAKGHHIYRIDPDRARLLPRYARYVEYAKRTIDEFGEAAMEEVLVNGRMRCEDLVKSAVENVWRKRVAVEEAENVDGDDDDEEEEGDSEAKRLEEKEKKQEIMQSVVASLRRLVEGGYLELVPPIDGDEEEEGETEFIDGEEPALSNSTKRQRSHNDEEDEPAEKRLKSEDGVAVTNDDTEDEPPPPGVAGDDPAILALLRPNRASRKLFPYGSVYRANARMFHSSIRAGPFALGRLVHERYGDRVPSAGAIVTAALKLVAHREHSPKPDILSEEERQRMMEDRGVFTPEQIMEYLPPPVLHTLKNKAGGARSNLSASLVALTEFQWPPCVMEVEDPTGHPDGGKFEIATRQLVEHLRSRIWHQVVLDSHGEVAARICSILMAKGHLEADAVADGAMIPAKDVREILHRLYRANYISLLNLQQTKQHNPSNAIYLWTVIKSRMYQTVTDNVCTALVNLRLRRQHQMELGKEWIDRAKEAGATDENDHERDRAKKEEFWVGLERLDNATLQLDETLMVLKDF